MLKHVNASSTTSTAHPCNELLPIVASFDERLQLRGRRVPADAAFLQMARPAVAGRIYGVPADLEPENSREDRVLPAAASGTTRCQAVGRGGRQIEMRGRMAGQRREPDPSGAREARDNRRRRIV